MHRAAGKQLFHVGGDHDAVVLGDANQRDQSNPNRSIHFNAIQSQANHSTEDGNRDLRKDDHGQWKVAEFQIDNQQVNQDDYGNNENQAAIRLDLVLERADRKQRIAGREGKRPLALVLTQLVFHGFDGFQVSRHSRRSKSDVSH